MTFKILKCPYCLESNMYDVNTENVICMDCGKLIEINLTQ